MSCIEIKLKGYSLSCIMPSCRIAAVMVFAILCTIATSCINTTTSTVDAAADSAASTCLTWHPVEVAFDCDATVTVDQSFGARGLCLRTYTQPDDKEAWLSFVRVELKRVDDQPLGSLQQLVDSGSLSCNFYRHPDSGDGMPDYILPYVGLRVRNPDGEEAVLVWESYNNGWSPIVPEGKWLDIRLDTGTFWMRYQGRNYNRNKGFQKLNAYAKGFQEVFHNAPSLKLDPEAKVVAIEFGSGPNLPGLLLAFIDDVHLVFAGGNSYRYKFNQPEVNAAHSNERKQ